MLSNVTGEQSFRTTYQIRGGPVAYKSNIFTCWGDPKGILAS